MIFKRKFRILNIIYTVKLKLNITYFINRSDWFYLKYHFFIDSEEPIEMENMIFGNGDNSLLSAQIALCYSNKFV